MALPKRRQSRARGRRRRANWKLDAPTITDCSQCHQPKLPHHICPSCGFYKGELVAAPKE